jgi:hypothetical protein
VCFSNIFQIFLTKKKYFPELPSEVQRNLPSTPKQTLTQPGPLKTLKRHRVSTPTRRLGIRNLSRNGLRYVSTRSASTRTYASTLPWNNQSPVHNQSTNSMDTAGGSSLPSASCPDGRKRRVCYYYDSVTANVDYGPEHCMVPRRVDMAHALVRSYGLLSDMRRLRTRLATEAEICAVHDPKYVELLRDVTPEAFNSDKSVRGRAEQFDIGTVSSCSAIDNPVRDRRAVGLLPALRGRVSVRGSRAGRRRVRRGHQLVGRDAPRVRRQGEQLLLRERHLAGHLQAPRPLPARSVPGHRRAPPAS